MPHSGLVPGEFEFPVKWDEISTIVKPGDNGLRQFDFAEIPEAFSRAVGLSAEKNAAICRRVNPASESPARSEWSRNVKGWSRAN